MASLTVPDGTPTLTVPSDLTQYAGRYSVPDTTVILRTGGGGLLATVEQTLVPEQILSSIAPTPVHDVPVSFIATDLGHIGQGVLPFVRKPNGDIGWIQIGLRLVPRIGPAQ